MPSIPGGPGTGGTGGTTPADDGDVTENDIPPDVPPDVETVMLTAFKLQVAAPGSFTDKSEKARKVEDGQELASACLVASKKIKQMNQNAAAAYIALNVKSDDRPITGDPAVDLEAVVRRIVEVLNEAGIGQDQLS